MILVLLILLLNIILFFIVIWAIISHTKSSISGTPIIRNDLKLVENVFQELKIEKTNTFYDLGSGYGDVVFIADRILKPINSIGIELSSFPYYISLLRKYLIKSKVQFIKADIKNVEIHKPDIIYIYLLPKLIKEITPILIKLKDKNPNLIIISPVFEIKKMKKNKIVKKYHKKFKKEVSIYVY